MKCKNLLSTDSVYSNDSQFVLQLALSALVKFIFAPLAKISHIFLVSTPQILAKIPEIPQSHSNVAKLYTFELSAKKVSPITTKDVCMKVFEKTQTINKNCLFKGLKISFSKACLFVVMSLVYF